MPLRRVPLPSLPRVAGDRGCFLCLSFRGPGVFCCVVLRGRPSEHLWSSGCDVSLARWRPPIRSWPGEFACHGVGLRAQLFLAPTRACRLPIERERQGISGLVAEHIAAIDATRV
jgi:hypothetical protein